MSLLIAAVVAYGFVRNVNERLFHPAIPRPLVLFFHAAVFSGWIAFFIFQSALIRTHNVALHRRTGWFGAALGVAVPVLGISTAIAMTRFDVFILRSSFPASAVIFPFYDMLAFTVPFALAIFWRKRPEFHRRLLLLATCALTSAAFTRFPQNKLPFVISYVGVDLLVVLGVLRDLIVDRRVHRVYLFGLSGFVVGQSAVIFTFLSNNPYLLRLTRAILD
ncbi:MAG: hypothetical protein ACRD5K_03455 [Candidatus Acidiferrales bacterium]